jgi:hypothetical protein
MPLPAIGRVVHYRIGGTDETPELRPATIVRIWHDSCINLAVDFDGTNDLPHGQPDGIRPTPAEAAACRGWRTSIHLGTALGTFRWPARR